MKRWLVSHWLECILLSLSAASLAVSAWSVVSVASDRTAQGQDLAYRQALRALSVMLQRGGRDELARLSTHQIGVGNRVLLADQIELLADHQLEPAAAPGGFIADHAVRFNDYQIRRAVERAFVARRLGPDTDENPSVFRTHVGESGSRLLSREANPYVMVVRSPYAERDWRHVRTRDWRRTGSVLGLDGDIVLPGDMADQMSLRLNGRDCRVRNREGRLLFYCSVAVASDVGRFFDLGFVPSTSDPSAALEQLVTDRQRRIWRNGKASNDREVDVAPGDVVDAPAVGQFVLSASERGTLASSQWINGRYTFANQQLGTISFFAGAGRASAPGERRPLVLALDADLSLDLEREASRFLQRHRGEIRRIGVVVLDLRSGGLLAVAEPGRAAVSASLLAFEPILLGSVVKPMVASAVLARRPDLAQLEIGYAGPSVGEVAGVRLRAPFDNSANGCAGRIDLVNFLRCSSNQYAAELLMRSLRQDGFRPSADGIVPAEVIERSSVGNGLAEVFDVDALGFRTAGRNPSLWFEPEEDDGADNVGRALLPWESRPWLMFPDTPGTPVDWVSRYAFGGWENRWTLLSAAEAYARIASGRLVRSAILAGEDSQTPAPHFDQRIQRILRPVRAGLRRVATDGTAAGLDERVLSGVLRGQVMLTKTGTLNEDTDRFKALALVVGTPADGSAAAAVDCGVVAVSYFEFVPAPGRLQGRLPSVHLDFAGGPFAEVLQRHWNRLRPCAPAVGNGGQ